MKPIKTLAFAFIAMAIVACATSPEVKWAQAQGLYNEVVGAINDYRAPCVPGEGVENAGPDHPRCYIDDNLMLKIGPLQSAADGVLREMEAASLTGDSLNYQRLAARFEGFLTQLLILKLEAEAARDG